MTTIYQSPSGGVANGRHVEHQPLEDISQRTPSPPPDDLVKVTSFINMRSMDFLEHVGIEPIPATFQMDLPRDLSDDDCPGVGEIMSDLWAHIEQVSTLVNMTTDSGVGTAVDTVVAAAMSIFALHNSNRKRALAAPQFALDNDTFLAHPENPQKRLHILPGALPGSAVFQHVKGWGLDLHGRRYEDIIETIVTGAQDSFGVRRVIVIDAVRAGDELCAYLPRVIGQALAMLAATRMAKIPFCVTDGSVWVPGFVKREPAGVDGSGQRLRCVYAPVVTARLLDQHALREEREGDLHAAVALILAIIDEGLKVEDLFLQRTPEV